MLLKLQYLQTACVSSSLRLVSSTIVTPSGHWEGSWRGRAGTGSSEVNQPSAFSIASENCCQTFWIAGALMTARSPSPWTGLPDGVYSSPSERTREAAPGNRPLAVDLP